MTEQEYLEGEKIAEVRHEYVDGQVYAMAGTSRRHNRIAVNFARKLALTDNQGNPCEIYLSDVKVRAQPAKSYYYPYDRVSGNESIIDNRRIRFNQV